MAGSTTCAATVDEDPRHGFDKGFIDFRIQKFRDVIMREGTPGKSEIMVVSMINRAAGEGGTVGRKLENRLTPADRERTSSGVIRWQNRIQFVRLRLVEEGLLARDSGRGIWSLTNAGRARLKELLEDLPSKR